MIPLSDAYVNDFSYALCYYLQIPPALIPLTTVQLLHMVIRFPKFTASNLPKLPKEKLPNVPKATRRKVLYIGFAVVCAFWVAFGIHSLWRSNYMTFLSQNAAILTETSADIQNLEQPISITPGQTSTTLPALVTSYQALVAQITKTKLRSTNIFTTGFYGLGDVKVLNDKSNIRLDSAEATLSDTVDGLIAVRKFIEYDPGTDLQLYVNGQEVDASERLSRTQEGINQVIADVQKASLPYSNDVTVLLTPLAKNATSVTTATANVWEEQVLSAQKAILKLIQKDQEVPLNTAINKLDELAEEYLAQRN